MSIREKRQARLRRHTRVRKRVSGTSERPRLSVFRSSRHIYAQVIDDVSGQTIAAASSLDQTQANGGNVAAARQVGEALATRAREKGVSQVVFDRGGFQYHGRVRALAEAAREHGLEF